MVQVIRREVRKRGVFGKLLKFLFIAFNLLMLVWLVSYWVQVGSVFNTVNSDVGRTGVSIGATLGTSFIIFFWAAGAIILGLLTMFSRGSKILIEETTE